MQFVVQAEIIPGIRSDHSFVTLNISFDHSKKGPGYWKLNTSLLRDSNYLTSMNKLLDIELSQTYSSKRLHWEMIKLSARVSTIQFASRKKKSNCNILAALCKKQAEIQNKMQNGPETLVNSAATQLKLINRDINKILAEKAMGAVIRSRSNWQYLSDRPSKYFLNLEKRN